MKKRSIKQSVVSRSISLSSIFMAGLVAVLYLVASILNGVSEQAAIERYDLSENAKLFIDGSKTLTEEVRAYAATGEMVHYDNYWKEINQDKNRETGVANMQSIGITESEQRLIDRMSELSNQLVPLEEEAMKLAAQELYDDALDYVYGKDYENTLEEIYGLRDEFLKSLDIRSMNKLHAVSIASKIITVILGITIIFLILVQIYNMRYVKNALIAPIITIRDQMQEIAKGNLSADFDLAEDESEVGEMVGAIHASKNTLKTYVADISDKLGKMADGNMNLTFETTYIGEFEPMGKSMRVIMDYMNATISKLKAQTESVANAVSASAAEVAGGSQQMADGAQEQSDSVEAMVISVADLTNDMDEVVKKALDAEKNAKDLTESLKDNTKQMEAMEKAMQDISASSEGIKSIINAISNIASQTNLLALNASIEAARAGEAGKGFAVVAEEVRILSEECRDASVKTNELIEQSLSAVSRGVKLTDETFRAIEGMMESVSTTSDKVGDIAESCKDKVEVLHDIKDNFAQLSGVVHNSAVAAKESSEAAAELNGHAEQLSTLFEQFSLQMA